jgi:hypothetical protein
MARSVALVLVVAIVGLSTLYAQKPADNPFAPSGNPFGALGAQLNIISSKLDAILKRMEPPGFRRVDLYSRRAMTCVGRMGEQSWLGVRDDFRTWFVQSAA